MKLITTGSLGHIKQEYHANIDKFSKGLIVAQIELLLQYCDRFYNRQFITRKISSHQILNRVEEILAGYFNSDDLIKKGLPTAIGFPGFFQLIADSALIFP